MSNLPCGLIQAGNNRYIKYVNGRLIFYSYSTAVVVVDGDIVYKTSEFYSITTSRHINQFLKDHFYPAVVGHPEIVSQAVIDSFTK